MAKKYTFPVPGCGQCPHHQRVGNFPSETRYCSGFKRRKPRRFRRSDPAYKAPKWCPRRISPPICRIYVFKDERSKFMETFWRRDAEKRNACISPSPQHYEPRVEIQLGMSPKQFYDEAKMNPLHNIFPPDITVESDEIIEIDDGLKPYYFYILDFGTVIPLPYFQMHKDT